MRLWHCWSADGSQSLKLSAHQYHQTLQTHWCLSTHLHCGGGFGRKSTNIRWPFTGWNLGHEFQPKIGWIPSFLKKTCQYVPTVPYYAAKCFYNLILLLWFTNYKPGHSLRTSFKLYSESAISEVAVDSRGMFIFPFRKISHLQSFHNTTVIFLLYLNLVGVCFHHPCPRSSTHSPFVSLSPGSVLLSSLTHIRSVWKSGYVTGKRL